MKTWREHCSPIIRRIILEVGTEDMKKLRKVLRDSYPYGEKKFWPYKVWLSEIRKQIHFEAGTLSEQMSFDDLPQFKEKK